MGYVAIQTKFLGPTNHRGARIKATAMDSYSDGKKQSITVIETIIKLLSIAIEKKNDTIHEPGLKMAIDLIELLKNDIKEKNNARIKT